MTEKAFAFPDFSSDCSGCAALCCVALHFDAGESFAIDKTAGTPCPNLAETDFSCTIHDTLADKGFGGCIRYDCNGAGQRTIQEVFKGKDWREDPNLLPEIMESFRIMRRLHDALEILALLGRKPLPTELGKQHQALLSQFETPADGWTPQALADLEQGQVFSKYSSALKRFQSVLRP